MVAALREIMPPELTLPGLTDARKSLAAWL
jgi:hypothetical protein